MQMHRLRDATVAWLPPSESVALNRTRSRRSRRRRRRRGCSSRPGRSRGSATGPAARCRARCVPPVPVRAGVVRLQAGTGPAGEHAAARAQDRVAGDLPCELVAVVRDEIGGRARLKPVRAVRRLVNRVRAVRIGGKRQRRGVRGEPVDGRVVVRPLQRPQRCARCAACRSSRGGVNAPPPSGGQRRWRRSRRLRERVKTAGSCA